MACLQFWRHMTRNVENSFNIKLVLPLSMRAKRKSKKSAGFKEFKKILQLSGMKQNEALNTESK